MKNLMKSLLKAQQEMGAATKGANNPFFRSKYADYGSVLEACKDPLNNNGIVILQPHVFQDGRNFVQTVLAHAESGETFSSMTEVVCKEVNNPQALGSAITYARRYGLQSLLSLPVEDDDGNAGSGNAKAYTPAAKVTTPKAEPKKETKEEKVAKADAVIAQVVETPKVEESKPKSAVAVKLEAGW